MYKSNKFERNYIFGDDLTKSFKDLIIDAGSVSGGFFSIPLASAKSKIKILKEIFLKKAGIVCSRKFGPF